MATLSVCRNCGTQANGEEFCEICAIAPPCPECNGSGVVAEHDPGCWGEASCGDTCPVPAQCQVCRGEGSV